MFLRTESQRWGNPSMYIHVYVCVLAQLAPSLAWCFTDPLAFTFTGLELLFRCPLQFQHAAFYLYEVFSYVLWSQPSLSGVRMIRLQCSKVHMYTTLYKYTCMYMYMYMYVYYMYTEIKVHLHMYMYCVLQYWGVLKYRSLRKFCL